MGAPLYYAPYIIMKFRAGRHLVGTASKVGFPPEILHLGSYLLPDVSV